MTSRDAAQYKYGVLIWRFQPFHLAHEAIVQQIYHDRLMPILVLGSVGGRKSERNPLTFSDRIELITAVFPEIKSHQFIPARDYPTDNNWWWSEIVKALHKRGVTRDNSIIYASKKDKDYVTSYPWNGEVRTNTHYLDVLAGDWPVRDALYPSALSLEAEATLIRQDFEAHRHWLDYRVYRKLKYHPAFGGKHGQETETEEETQPHGAGGEEQPLSQAGGGQQST